MSGWVKVPVDWFGDDEVEDRSAAAIVLHLSALADCARHLRDGRLPARTLRRLWPVPNVDDVVRELVDAGWWAEVDDGWQIVDWQTFILPADEVERMREQSRITSERYRRHKAGDHSMCDRCAFVRGGDKSRDASQQASPTASVTRLRTDPIRTEGEEREEAGPGGSAGAPPTRPAEVSALPLPPHPHTGDCCALPDIHPVHQAASR